jgi:signal transduction histidine kinase
LGLTVVQKIVQDHGGDVVVEETSGRGTVFRMTLPLSSPTMEGVRDGKLETPPLRQAKRTPVE